MEEKSNIRVSVSQIKKFKSCEMQWWYEYGHMKLKSGGSPATRLGSEVHNILENYLLEGTTPPDTKAGRIASCGLDKLPAPETIEVEKSVTMPLTDKANILCRIDMVGKDFPYIGDHKTTSSFHWAKTVGELKHDIQLLTYAYAAYHEEKPPEVGVELLYYRTKGLPISMPVKNVVSWSSIEDNWGVLGVIANDMAEKIKSEDGAVCKPNTKACADWGGCPHLNYCPHSPENSENKSFTEVVKDDMLSVENKNLKRSKIMEDQAEKIRASLGMSILPPKTIVSDRGCTRTHLKNVAGDLAEEAMKTGNMTTAAAKAFVQSRISSNLTDRRWAFILGFLGKAGSLRVTIPETDNGKVVPAPEPQHDQQKPLPSDDDNNIPFSPVERILIENYKEAEEGQRPAPSTLPPHAAAIAAPLVVMVDAHFSIAVVDAITLDDWLAPYIEKVEKMQKKPMYLLDIDYGRGDKFLAGVLAISDCSSGLIMASSTHPRIGVALSVLSNQGAVIIYGR